MESYNGTVHIHLGCAQGRWRGLRGMPWTRARRGLCGIVGGPTANLQSGANLLAGLFIVQLVGRPDWPELQDKVARTQKLQAGPTAPVAWCAVRTMRPDEEEATLTLSAIQTGFPGIVDRGCGWCRRA